MTALEAGAHDVERAESREHSAGPAILVTHFAWCACGDVFAGYTPESLARNHADHVKAEGRPL